MSGVFVKSIECGDRILGTPMSWALIDIENEVSVMVLRIAMISPIMSMQEGSFDHRHWCS